MSGVMQNPDHSPFAGIEILPGTSMQEYLDEIRFRHLPLYERMDIAHLDPAELSLIYQSLDCFSPFDTKENGGRGDAYRNTQLAYPLVRSEGIHKLCDLAIPPDMSDLAATCLLDALGGNGTITRAMRLLRTTDAPTIFTGDVAAPMIVDALAQGLPAVRQSVERWLFRDASIDGVIFAYGTHHLPREQRPQAVAQAHRVLRPGGRVVVHDFEEGTPTARWYSEALDRYTYTGHKHDHFSPQEMHDLLVDAGFRDVRIQYLYDPCVVFGASPETARRDVLNYMYSLFALANLTPTGAAGDQKFWAILEDLVCRYATFTPEECARYGARVDELSIDPSGDQFRVELPRVALVGSGTR